MYLPFAAALALAAATSSAGLQPDASTQPSTSSTRLRVSTAVAAALQPGNEPTTPETVARARSEGDYVALNWEPVPGAVGYAIYRSEPDGSNPIQLTAAPIEGLAFIDAEHARSGRFRYIIEPIYAKGTNTTPTHLVVESTATSFNVQAQATAHGPNNVTSDAELTASATLSEIRSFLSSQNSFLASNIVDYGGAVIDPAQVISNAATQYQISPWALITMLEKESSIVRMSTSPGPNSNTIKCAAGYGCDKGYATGFVTQVTWAARGLRSYLTSLSTSGQTVSGWRIGVAKATLDCLTITPENAATAALYTYNPLAGAGWGGCTTFGANYRYWNLFYNVFSFSSGGGSTAPPAAPTNLVATAQSSSSIRVTWNDSSTTESAFNVYTWTGSWVLLATLAPNTTQYVDSGLQAGTTRYYFVCAVNAAGGNCSSNYVYATTPAAAVTPPAAPSALSATPLSSSSISLSWKDLSSNETNFHIYRWGGSAWVWIGAVGVNTTNFADSGLSAHTTYTYTVCAVNDAGGNCSATTMATTY